MKNFKLMMTILILIMGCKKDCIELTTYEYELVKEDGIYVEKFTSDITDDNRYNSNNEIYKICNEFIYDYYYQDATGNKFLLERNKGEDTFDPDNSKEWFFVPFDEPNRRTIMQINKTIGVGLDPFKEIDPDYNQTVIRFIDVHHKGAEQQRAATGLIENEMNVWAHPPRHGLFAMLEFAPFPFIQAPYEIGNTWVFDFINIKGENWSDPRWLEFEGQINIVSNYEITDKKTIDTKLGQLECYEITGIATNPHGEAKLVSYFNEEYGFVKLDYTNINSSKMLIELVEVKE